MVSVCFVCFLILNSVEQLFASEIYVTLRSFHAPWTFHLCLSASAPEISLALNAVYLSKNCQIEPYIKTLHSKAEEVTLIIAKTGAHLDFRLIPIYAMFRGFLRFLDLKGKLQMSPFFFPAETETQIGEESNQWHRDRSKLPRL